MAALFLLLSFLLICFILINGRPRPPKPPTAPPHDPLLDYERRRLRRLPLILLCLWPALAQPACPVLLQPQPQACTVPRPGWDDCAPPLPYPVQVPYKVGLRLAQPPSLAMSDTLHFLFWLGCGMLLPLAPRLYRRRP